MNKAALDYERYKELYNQVSQDYNYIKNTYKRNKATKEDKYLNALQIKYALDYLSQISRRSMEICICRPVLLYR